MQERAPTGVIGHDPGGDACMGYLPIARGQFDVSQYSASSTLPQTPRVDSLSTQYIISCFMDTHLPLALLVRLVCIAVTSCQA